MKNFLVLLVIGCLFMTGCETTREISLDKDNSGTLITTTDMSGMMGMAKMSGKQKETDSLDVVVDTTVSLSNMADSLTDITSEEKTLMKKGKIGLQMNFHEDKLIIKIEFPFSEPAQINNLDRLSSKVLRQTVKKQLGKDTALLLKGGGNTSEVSGSIDDYFAVTYSKGMIEKKLDKQKYANVGSDEAMNTLKEMSEMGVGNSTLILNLPRPVKKAEGKNVKLSDDKKKVIITSSTEDFFDDATQLEFRIEY